MKRFLLWILMVLAMIGMIVGGTIGFFYMKAGKDSLPPSSAAFGGAELGEPIGYNWSVPVFWGAYERVFDQSPSLSVTKLGTLSEGRPELTFGEWVNGGSLTIKDAGGKEVFSGSLAEYENFSYSDNGQYTATLRLWHKVPNERPAQPQGWYEYSFKFTLDAQAAVSFSKTSVSQGSVIGIKVTGTLGANPPQAECDLGDVWFSKNENGAWLGYLPVAFNAESGTHSFTLHSGGESITQELEIYQAGFARVEEKKDEKEEKPTPAGAGEEYRNKIWPLYSLGNLPKQWLGGFTQPVKGSTVQDYGVYLVGKDKTTRSSDLTLSVGNGLPVVMPTDGVIRFAGDLLLCGKTVVIDHGCGLKTYISGLGQIYVSEGHALLQGEEIGLTGSEDIIIEMRIGNKSINPWDAWRGNGGLFYR